MQNAFLVHSPWFMQVHSAIADITAAVVSTVIATVAAVGVVYEVTIFAAVAVGVMVGSTTAVFDLLQERSRNGTHL